MPNIANEKQASRILDQINHEKPHTFLIISREKLTRIFKYNNFRSFTPFCQL